MNMIFIYCTYPNQQSAEKLTNILLAKKLVVCVNLFSIQSSYVWGKKIVKTKEWAVFYKTEKKLFTKVKSQIEKLHPYEIPVIIEIPLGRINKKYYNWLEAGLISNEKNV